MLCFTNDFNLGYIFFEIFFGFIFITGNKGKDTGNGGIIYRKEIKGLYLLLNKN